MKPIYIHSGMTGAPQYANANDNINGILEACLINGFNLRTATSASASGGVLTLNFASNPGFEALQTVEVALADVALVNGQHRVVANASNQVTIAIAGLPDGAVGSTGAGITIKQAGAGWSKPYSSTTTAVFRPPAGNRRYLRCVHAVNADFEARGYEEMTDVDTGTEPFPTLEQNSLPVAVAGFGYGAPVNAPWILIVTDKWLIFSLANELVPSYAVGCLFFGDMADEVKVGDPYSTLICLKNGVYLLRNALGAEGSVPAGLDFGSGFTQYAPWPSVIAEGLRLVPYVTVHQRDGVMRGVLPCAYKLSPHAPAGKFLDIYSNVNGLVGRAKPVALTSFAGSIGLAISLDEDVWL